MDFTAVSAAFQAGHDWLASIFRREWREIQYAEILKDRLAYFGQRREPVGNSEPPNQALDEAKVADGAPNRSVRRKLGVPNQDAGGQFLKLFGLQKVCEKYPLPTMAQPTPALVSSQICKSGAAELPP